MKGHKKQSDVQTVTTARPLISPAFAGEVVFIGPASSSLLNKLRVHGIFARHYVTLEEGADVLRSNLAKIAVVQVDWPDQQHSGIAMVAGLQAENTLSSSIIFVSETDDLESRLAAVRAGGCAYFVPPIESIALSNKIRSILPPPQGAIQGRALLILEPNLANENLKEQLLEQQIEVLLLHNPDEILDKVTEFQPDTIVIDLDLNDINGLELSQVLRQHHASYGLPIILLCQEQHRDNYLQCLHGAGDDLFSKPIADSYLCWLIQRRMQRNKAVTHTVKQLRFCDRVTGLYNRQYFLNAFQQQFNHLAQTTACAVLIVDVKLIIKQATCDSDEIYTAIGEYLRLTFRRAALVARLGDNRFAVMVYPANKQQLLRRARFLRTQLQSIPTKFDTNKLVSLSCYVGIGYCDLDCQVADTLLHYAYHASNLAHTDQTGIHLATPVLNPKPQLSLKTDFLEQIKDAIRHQRLTLRYLPILNLDDSKRRFEVLLRFGNGHETSLFTESVFREAAEHPLGIYLDRWVIDESLRALSEQQDQIPNTKLFINLLPVSIRDTNFSAWLQKKLSQSLIPNNSLVFEINETTVRDFPKQCQKFAQHVHDIGASIALERFGCHYDSLSLLHKVSADYAKLDRQIVKLLSHINETDELQFPLADLVQKARLAGASVIATGIEDLNVLPVLQACSIKSLQGFVLQRPLERMIETEL